MSLPKKKERKVKTLTLPDQHNIQEDQLELGSEQQQALEELRTFMKAKDRDFHLLEGYAGTGKSTLCRAFLAEMKVHELVFCATTNKATGVLKNMIVQDQPEVRCSTIHRLLKLIPEDSGQGWKLRQVGEPRLDDITLIILDECSMISRDLWNHLQELPCRFPVKILFMGDRAQLPPVGEEMSPCFSIPHRSCLTRVYRQGKFHPILKYSMLIREAMKDAELPIPAPDEVLSELGEDIQLFDSEEAWLASWLHELSRPEAQNDEDRVRCLTWTNRRVARWNQWISSRLYPSERGPFPQHQPLILTSPITKGGWTEPHRMLMATDESVRLRRCEPLDWRGLGLWELDLENREGDVASGVYCPPEHELAWDREVLAWQQERFGQSLNNEVIERWQRRRMGVQPSAAITVHRSQGSSFHTVYLDWLSLRACPDREQQLQLLYVAVTRAQQRLCILV